MADSTVPLDKLRTIPLLRGFSDEQLHSLSELFVPVEAGQLFDVHDTAESLYLLLDGEVTLYQGEREMFTLHPPALLGELGAFAGLRRNSRAEATAGATVLSIERVALQDFFATHAELGLHYEKNLLYIAAEKIDRDQTRLEDMRENLVRTQKAMKQMREYLLESEDTAVSAHLHDMLDGLIQRNRRVNYRVSPPSALAANLRLDDKRAAQVVQISRTHLSFTCSGTTPEAGARMSGVLSLSGPEIPVSGKVLRTKGDRIDLELDLLLDDYAATLEGYLTRVQLLDFLA